MKTGQKRKDLNFLVPSIQDEVTKVNVSPEHLPHYSGEGAALETDAAYHVLDHAKTAEEFHKAVAILVFHARHLSPVEHANLARLISKPFQRTAGKPENTELKCDAYDYAYFSKSTLFKHALPERRLFIADLAKRYKTTIAIAGRAMREAEKRVSSEKEASDA